MGQGHGSEARYARANIPAMSLVKSLVRRGKFSKWFDRRAAHTTNELYKQGFALPVTRRVVQHMCVSHVFWIEQDDQTVAATMLTRLEEREPVYRVLGLTVDSNFRRQGYGTALLATIDKFVGAGSTVYLCVDKDRGSTDWLVAWYTRVGFSLAYDDPRLSYGGHEIPLVKLVK